MRRGRPGFRFAHQGYLLSRCRDLFEHEGQFAGCQVNAVIVPETSRDFEARRIRLQFPDRLSCCHEHTDGPRFFRGCETFQAVTHWIAVVGGVNFALFIGGDDVGGSWVKADRFEKIRRLLGQAMQGEVADMNSAKNSNSIRISVSAAQILPTNVRSPDERAERAKSGFGLMRRSRPGFRFAYPGHLLDVVIPGRRVSAGPGIQGRHNPCVVVLDSGFARFARAPE